MKMRDGGGEAEPEPGAGLAPAGVETGEAVENSLSILGGNAWTVVGDAEFDPALDRGDIIDYDALSEESREAWLEVTAAVAAGLR